MGFYEMYLRRRNKVTAPAVNAEPNALLFSRVASVDANIRKLGYALSGDLAMALLRSDSSFIKHFHDTLVRNLKEIKGVRRYSPMYPNFPKQVMEASEAELYLNAVFHYFGDVVGLRILPDYPVEERPELDFDQSKVTVINLGSLDDAISMVNDLIMQTGAFSETDRKDLLSLNEGPLTLALQSDDRVVPNRENRAFLRTIAQINSDRLLPDTATDLLRLAVAYSGGDLSLATPTKFRLTRGQRREIMRSLADLANSKGINTVVEDMLRHEAAWKRLGERVHPGEFKPQVFGNAIEAFRRLRNNEGKTFNSRVEAALASGDLKAAVALLKTRPGDFARRLDVLLRDFGTKGRAYVLDEFSEVAAGASPTVLVQALTHFLNRQVETGPRVFFPKGNVARMKAIVDERHGIDGGNLVRTTGIISNALEDSLKDRSPLGKVWVDPAIHGLAIPFGVRSSNKALRTVGRGSRLPIASDSNILRFFIWWKDGQWRTDIDLSASVLDENFNSAFDLTYYNLKTYGATHSGDITSAPHGASEFIDIDIEKVRSNGGRYVLMSVLSYTGQTFTELPECFAGFMERRDGQSGKIFDARTVTNRLDLTADSRSATPFIFDLQTREAIWVDLNRNLRGRSYGGYNVASNKAGLVETVEALATLRPPSLYDLILHHVYARGMLVHNREDADYVFAEDGDFNPFETERVLAELL